MCEEERSKSRSRCGRGESYAREVDLADPSRFRTLMFWVYDDLESLAPRLDKRVDRMVEVRRDST